MQPGDILPFNFGTGLVALSFAISLLGTYVALLAAGSVRGGTGSKPRIGYLAVTAVALAGVGIWGMHVIAMAAQLIPSGVSYSLLLTVLSLIAVVGLVGAALWYVGSRRFTLRRCVVSGVFGGLGMAGMHYLGMNSMRMNAYFEWNPLLVLASVLIAVVVMIVSLWLVFSVQGEVQRIGAALLIAAGACGSQYASVMGATVVCTTPRHFSGVGLYGPWLPYAVFLISMVTLIVMRIELYRGTAEARQGVVPGGRGA